MMKPSPWMGTVAGKTRITSGWWLSPTPLKNHGVSFVSWDGDIPNMMGKSWESQKNHGDIPN